MRDRARPASRRGPRAGRAVARSAVLVALGLALGACDGGEEAPTAAAARGRVFTEADLERIALGPADAPPGMEVFLGPIEGQSALPPFFSSDVEVATIDPDFGLRDARAVVFVRTRAGPDSYVGSLAVLFEDGETAAAAFQVFLEDRKRGGNAAESLAPALADQPAVEEPAAGFGGGIVLKGPLLYFALGPQASTVYLWRVGNLVLLVEGDDVVSDAVREAAELMNSRAA